MYKKYLKDNSPRTITARRAYLAFVVACSVMLVSVFGYAVGSWKYGQRVAMSSTAIGTELTFKRSGVKAKLSGLYTDKQRSVLIARIGFTDPKDSVKMPFKGSDYAAFISSDAIPKNTRQIDALTGRLSSDGDMFFVLPRPVAGSVYSVFLMNTNYLAEDAGKGDNNKKPVDITKNGEKSITAALSSYDQDAALRSPEKSAYVVASDNLDAVGFRMTLTPSLDDEKYQPIVLDTVLLDKNNDFQFTEFFEKVFIDSARGELQSAYGKAQHQVDVLKKRGAEMAERLKQNPNDTVARDEYDTIANRISRLDDEKRSYVEQLAAYDNIKADDKLFSNLNTKALVINK